MSGNQTTRYKRRQYIIDKKFQKAFIMRFSTLVLLGGLLTVATIYLLAMQSTTVAFLNSRVIARPTGEFIFPLLVETTLIVTIAIALGAVMMTVLFTHRIAGPLYRFKKVIEALKQGDLSSDFHIRSKDQFHDLATVLSETIKDLKLHISGIKEKTSALRSGSSAILEDDVPENKRAALKELKKASDELDKLVRHFKT